MVPQSAVWHQGWWQLRHDYVLLHIRQQERSFGLRPSRRRKTSGRTAQPNATYPQLSAGRARKAHRSGRSQHATQENGGPAYFWYLGDGHHLQALDIALENQRSSPLASVATAVQGDIRHFTTSSVAGESVSGVITEGGNSFSCVVCWSPILFENGTCALLSVCVNASLPKVWDALFACDDFAKVTQQDQHLFISSDVGTTR